MTTPEDKTRRLIRALRKRTTFPGSDLALLHKQLDSIVQALWILCFCSFLAGTVFASEVFSTSQTVIFSVISSLACIAFVAFFLLRLQACSSAISLLISKNTFNLS